MAECWPMVYVVMGLHVSLLSGVPCGSTACWAVDPCVLVDVRARAADVGEVRGGRVRRTRISAQAGDQYSALWRSDDGGLTLRARGAAPAQPACPWSPA